MEEHLVSFKWFLASVHGTIQQSQYVQCLPHIPLW